MARSHSPTVRRRRLASELRRLRDLAELTIDEVGEKLECSASKISRIETGHVGVTPRDVRDMLELYGVHSEGLEELVQLSREARKKGWWHNYSEVFTGAFVGLEAEAATLRAYQALLVPGLLQTADYTREVTRASRPDIPAAELDRRVSGRQARQKLLAEADPPRYWAVIDEAVLCRPVGGPKAMHSQMLRLIELAELPHVTVQIVPFSAGAHAGMEGAFLILGFPEQADPDVVYVENTSTGQYLEEPPEILRYTLKFDHLRAMALGPDATLEKIAEAATRYAEET
ncbi:MAG TPA: helix-turn-helix transcriptional regulator [Pseudonocardiaceae bacterium]|jgi:transcriptional regulator with XRE-family HTH domain|nr:helix-turn-helix transcriptional regulator [Pseudonocardiaceae bacterium]